MLRLRPGAHGGGRRRVEVEKSEAGGGEEEKRGYGSAVGVVGKRRTVNRQAGLYFQVG